MRSIALAGIAALMLVGCATAPELPPTAARKAADLPANGSPDAMATSPGVTLVPGDQVTFQVFGRPEMAMTTYVGEDGRLTVPLAGAIDVAGLTPTKAGQRVASALRQGKYLVDPQVTVALAQSRALHVSVLGSVKTPGRFAIDPRTTVLDALAQAGGITENGAGTVVLLRPDRTGKLVRFPIDLKGLGQGRGAVPTLTLRGGDSLFVPPAEQFYILGEVKAPNMYRLEPGMTVVQALSRGGGVTPRGSDSRIELKRRKADGSYATSSVSLGDMLQADDVIRVKERIF